MDDFGLNSITLHLYSFICVGKHMSFTKAAEELCLTQGAVSHRIKALEEQVGFSLFHRLPRKIVFTPEGLQLFEVCSQSLVSIEARIRDIRGMKLSGRLRVSCAPSLAGCWLLPRLGQFRGLYPDLDIDLVSSYTQADFEKDNVEVAISCGTGDHAGLHAIPFLQDNLLPVCSPAYMREWKVHENPAALRNCALIHERSGTPGTSHASGWELWAKWAGVYELNTEAGYSFDRAELVTIAAREGLGVALGREWLVNEWIQRGDLVVPFMLVVPSPQSYFVVSTVEGAGRARVRAFTEWLLEQSRG